MTPAKAKAMIAALPYAIRARIAAGLDDAASRVAADVRERLDRQDNWPVGSRISPSAMAADLDQAIATGHDAESGAVVITVDPPFAAALEYGTARMAARPFLRPAAAEAEPEIRDRLAVTLAETCRAALDDAS